MQTLIAISEIVRNLGLALAAFGGIALAWWNLVPETTQAGSAALQADLGKAAHVTELFNRADGQLVDDRIEVRLAAIYVLREVGRAFRIYRTRCSSCYKRICASDSVIMARRIRRST